MPTRSRRTTRRYKFVYNSGVVNRLSPANGDNDVAVPTLRWAPSQDAEEYDGHRSTTTVGEARRGDDVGPVLDAVGGSRPGADGPFTWTVSAIDGDGHHSPVDPDA